MEEIKVLIRSRFPIVLCINTEYRYVRIAVQECADSVPAEVRSGSDTGEQTQGCLISGTAHRKRLFSGVFIWSSLPNNLCQKVDYKPCCAPHLIMDVSPVEKVRKPDPLSRALCLEGCRFESCHCVPVTPLS